MQIAHTYKTNAFCKPTFIDHHAVKQMIASQIKLSSVNVLLVVVMLFIVSCIAKSTLQFNPSPKML